MKKTIAMMMQMCMRLGAMCMLCRASFSGKLLMCR